MIPALQDLRIVELGRLILHEDHDEERLVRVRGRIYAEGVQRNPVIVSPFEEGFLVLDGAHRVHALRGLEAHLALVQIVDPPPPAESWSHLLTAARVERLREFDELRISEKDSHDGWMAEVEAAGGRRLYLRPQKNGLPEEVRALWAMQRVYPGDSEVRRIGSDEVNRLVGDDALIRYRVFSPGELIEVVRCGAMLPAGITRFRVEERVLGARFPLRSLQSDDTQSRNAELRSLVEERWRENRIRRYDEPVVLFE